MKNKDISRWIVLKGTPVFTGTTREQARQYVKKNKNKVGLYTYQYIGKVLDAKRKIVLEI